MLTQAFIDRQRFIAENTHVVEVTHGVIVIAHPGQEPSKDPKYLKENFGVLPGNKVIRLSESRHAPPIAKLQAQLDKLEAAELEDAPVVEDAPVTEGDDKAPARRRGAATSED